MKNHYPFFDMAYQGFASGDMDKDAKDILGGWSRDCMCTIFFKNNGLVLIEGRLSKVG